MGKKNRNIALGTLLIGLTGYAVGLLTAPKSGKETRRALQKHATRAKNEAERKLKALHSELTALIADGRMRVGKVKSEVRIKYADALDKAQLAKEKAREILSAVHEGDADDKDLQDAIEEVNKAIEHLKKYASKNT